jgi:hypothetical protein
MVAAAVESVEASVARGTSPPSSGTRPTLTSVVCNATDALLQNVPVAVTFTFEERLDPEPLLRALEQTLEAFPVFGGRLRLTRDALFIDCNGAGVSTSVAHLDEDFIPLLQHLGNGQNQDSCELLDPERCLKGQAPLLSVRFNQARDRGTVLGLCWHHSVGDMATFMTFMKAWAATSRAEAFTPPFIPSDRHATFVEAIRGRGPSRPGIRRLGLLETLRFARYLMFEAKQQERARFYFSDGELEALRSAFSEQAGKKLSRNDALCAHLASIIFPLDPVARPHTLAMPIDWRARLNLPRETLGNFIGGVLLEVKGKPQPAEIASRIRTAVDNAIDRHLDYESSTTLLEAGGGARAAKRHVSLGIDPLRGTLLITNWTRFGVHDIEFQGQRCSAFAPAGRSPFPWLSAITEGPRDRGLVYSVSLPPAVGKALKTEACLEQLHRYRPAGEALPEAVTRIHGWL